MRATYFLAVATAALALKADTSVAPLTLIFHVDRPFLVRNSGTGTRPWFIAFKVDGVDYGLAVGWEDGLALDDAQCVPIINSRASRTARLICALSVGDDELFDKIMFGDGLWRTVPATSMLSIGFHVQGRLRSVNEVEVLASTDKGASDAIRSTTLTLSELAQIPIYSFSEAILDLKCSSLSQSPRTACEVRFKGCAVKTSDGLCSLTPVGLQFVNPPSQRWFVSGFKGKGGTGPTIALDGGFLVSFDDLEGASLPKLPGPSEFCLPTQLGNSARQRISIVSPSTFERGLSLVAECNGSYIEGGSQQVQFGTELETKWGQPATLTGVRTETPLRIQLAAGTLDVSYRLTKEKARRSFGSDGTGVELGPCAGNLAVLACSDGLSGQTSKQCVLHGGLLRQRCDLARLYEICPYNSIPFNAQIDENPTLHMPPNVHQDIGSIHYWVESEVLFAVICDPGDTGCKTFNLTTKIKTSTPPTSKTPPIETYLAHHQTEFANLLAKSGATLLIATKPCLSIPATKEPVQCFAD
jgi:hypothetical protein